MKQQRGQSGRGRRPRPTDGTKSDIEQKLIEIRRVTRVVAGGKRMRFRACVILGDRKGTVGMGVGKGADVTMAVQKAVTKAQRRMVKVPLTNDTIPHIIRHKEGAAFILLKPAPRGTGVKAGGAVRSVLDIAGIQNVVAKILGSKNKMNNVKATIAALALLRPRKQHARGV